MGVIRFYFNKSLLLSSSDDRQGDDTFFPTNPYKKMKQKPYFTRLIQLWGIVFIVGVAISIMAVDIVGSYRDFNQRSEQIRTDHIAKQKQIIKQEVMRVVELIAYEQSQSEALTKSKIQSRVYEAFAIAQNIYQENRAAKSKDEIQKMILDALRDIRFENNSGYYFATSLNGVEILFADKPELEGVNLLELQDSRGKFVIKDMIDIARQTGEGFYEYHWTKPKMEGNDYKKISFIKRFAPYDWFIGTGLYVEDITKQIKTNILADISRIRFGKEGYVFVNRFNGDALVSNGKFIGGTKKLWEVFSKNPGKTKYLYEISRKAALEPEGDYIYYTMVKLSDQTKESPKTSFIYGIPEFQWYVGAGVYLDDVESDIVQMQAELNAQVREKLLYFSLIAVVILLGYLFLFRQLSKKLQNDFTVFVSFFKNAAGSNQVIDRDLVQFHELDQIAGNANSMLQDKIQAEKDKDELIKKLHVAQKMESIGLMAGGVAHDLNNILSGIVAYPELILQQLEKESELRKPIEAIQQSGQRAATVVADLLTVARGAASIREVHTLNDLIEEYENSPEYKQLQELHPNVTYQYQLSAVDSVISCSPVHVKKCLMNLVTNASEAIRGEGTVVVATRVQSMTEEAAGKLEIDAGEYVILSVQDTGPGISNKDLEYIFEPFYTKKVMGRSGTGLGLAVVWNTMEDHDGKIVVESGDTGTCFQLYFPTTKAAPVSSLEDDTTKELTGKSEHILVVDDEPQLRDIACQMLMSLGYKVDTVNSGEAAIDFVKKTGVDLIVLDMLMEPGLNGRETYEQIKRIRPGQKAIITSGFSESHEVRATMQLGAGGFIKKPYSLKQLGRAVKEALQS